MIDINGYYVSNNGLWFHPVTPCRVWDTRQPGDGPLVPNGVRSFGVGGTCGIPPSTATGVAGPPVAYALNVTALPLSTLGYLTVFPIASTGEANPPLASTLNAPTGAITANATIIQAGLGGSISAVASDETNLVIDITGYYSGYDPAVPSGSYYPIAPTRILDTRQTSGMFSGTLPVVVGGATSTIPSDAQAFVLNATVVPSGSLDYLTLWPYDQPMPVVSTLNALDRWITSNMAIVPSSANGLISAFASNPTDLIIDVFGYFQ